MATNKEARTGFENSALYAALWFTGFSIAVSMTIATLVGCLFFGEKTTQWPDSLWLVTFPVMIAMLFVSVFATAKIYFSSGQESVWGRAVGSPEELPSGQYRIVGSMKIDGNSVYGRYAVLVYPDDENNEGRPIVFLKNSAPSGAVLLVKPPSCAPGTNLLVVETEYLNPS